MNNEIQKYWSLYSGNQGSGYITPVEIESLTEIIKDPVCIVDITINPGDLTDFKGFFSRELLFVGILNNHTNSELIFLMGKETDLFQTKYYYQAVFLISETRLFEMFSAIAGRDFNYINGKWN